MLGATTLFGGIGSVAFGGDFIDGAMTGLNIGLYNHTWVDGGELPEVTVTGKARFHLNTAVISQPMPYPVRSPGVLGLVVGVFWICEHRADLEKGIERAYSSIKTMATKTMECRPGYVYHLVATTDGMYPNVRGGNVHLNAGDTWKIGETVNGSRRYPQNYLNDLNVKMVPSSGPMTNKYQLWIEKKRQLIKYASKYGSLPPSNKLFK